jgi:hypothetical protein
MRVEDDTLEAGGVALQAKFQERFVETADRSPAILPARQIEMKSS